MHRCFAFLLAAACLILLAAGGLCEAGAMPDAQTYRIEVDITNQITTVFRTDDRSVACQMICSSGLGQSTPLGTFQLEPSRERDRSEWYYIDKYKCFVKYPTRIQGPILFHSLPYLGMDMSRVDREAEEELGARASHGCIRLRWEDAQWISTHCADGTTVVLFVGAAKKPALREALLRKSFRADRGMAYQDYLRSACGDGAWATLGLGSSGDAVTALQQNLAALGLLGGDSTGLYDEATAAAVARYQCLAGMSPTGVANALLCDMIESDASDTAD